MFFNPYYHWSLPKPSGVHNHSITVKVTREKKVVCNKNTGRKLLEENLNTSIYWRHQNSGHHKYMMLLQPRRCSTGEIHNYKTLPMTGKITKVMFLLSFKDKIELKGAHRGKKSPQSIFPVTYWEKSCVNSIVQFCISLYYLLEGIQNLKDS